MHKLTVTFELGPSMEKAMLLQIALSTFIGEGIRRSSQIDSSHGSGLAKAVCEAQATIISMSVDKQKGK
jgi:hypothetical protein